MHGQKDRLSSSHGLSFPTTWSFGETGWAWLFSIDRQSVRPVKDRQVFDGCFRTIGDRVSDKAASERFLKQQLEGLG